MADSYTELFYHIVWAMKDREGDITADVEEILYSYISSLCRTTEIYVLALDGTSDHVHMACSIPASLSVSQVVKDIKGKSAYHVNHVEGDLKFLTWQPGYGALSFSKRNIKSVVDYVNRQ